MAARPQVLADLPYAANLVPHAGALTAGERYDTVHFDGAEFDGDASSASFLDCAFTRVTFQGGGMRRARFSDAWLNEVRLTGTDLAETTWQDGTFIGCVAAGVPAFGTTLQRLAFQGCKLDSVNFRQARLTEVTFDDCVLRDVDFSGATLTRTSFPGSRLSRVDFTGSALDQADLRGAELGITVSPGSLRGAIISPGQLAEIAAVLAESIGITVRAE